MLRRTPRTGRGFIEPLLDVGDAIPLHMVRIPGGTFTMGSPDDEPEREEREGPQHEVTVPMCFMGRYPVTQAQYEQVMETNPATQYDTGRFVAPNKPVVGVSWDNATTFCQRLSERTGRAYRLPFEAEWEYACRAGTTTPFFFGNTLTTEVVNYDGSYTYGDGPKSEYREEPMPVDYFKLANAFGLCDMHGNVDEWCADHWHENYDGAPTDGSAWIEGGDSSRRVLRGGSWYNSPRYCRSAYRSWLSPVNHSYDVGFRVVCSPPRALL
ncbi:MAG: formylglycine-generating enzyme family protein [Leptolyngbya sp. SIO1E4]|nr:formylglycine-generating enzyme family protein [Leptolyngbya sp. SIO1E4]